jgi:hypothetical protein
MVRSLQNLREKQSMNAENMSQDTIINTDPSGAETASNPSIQEQDTASKSCSMQARAEKDDAPRVAWGLEVAPWQEPVDGPQLLEELAETLRRFIVLPEWGDTTLALWVLHTYAFELRDVATYVGIESPDKRCGKTTLLAVLSGLANRPVVAANISPSAFFRVIEETRPTLFIDEADTFLRKNEELRGILNSGYSRNTAFVVRVTSQADGEAWAQSKIPNPKLQVPMETGGEEDRGTGPKLARYSCWCPKAMAAIGRLPETLADRSIIIRMERKPVTDARERVRELDATELRRKCTRFVRDEAARIAAARPAIPEILNDRAGDIWEPLLALADLAGGEWPDRARRAAMALTGQAQEQSPTTALLLDVRFWFCRNRGDRVFSRALVEWLISYGARPWNETLGGREITDLWLAQQLRPYGVVPRRMYIQGKQGRG